MGSRNRLQTRHAARRHQRARLRRRLRRRAARRGQGAGQGARSSRFRDAFGQWDPRSQRPELWQLYQGQVNPGEHLRAFPLSDWTELDVWQYIERERHRRCPPIYFAHEREVVKRDGMWLAVGPHVEPRPGEAVETRTVRFRTVGRRQLHRRGRVSRGHTWPRSSPRSPSANVRERGATRADDRFSETAMEDRKREGYF